MDGPLKKIKTFVAYWYLRYLLATELYMVEPWERRVVHVVLTIMFAAFWYFNYRMVGNAVADLVAPRPYLEAVL